MFSGRKSRALKAFRDELISLVEGVSQSVVTVRLTTSTLGSETGSGWFVQPDIVVTNHHVVDGPSPKVRLRLKGGRVIPGEIVGSDPDTDLAVIRCDPTGAEPLELRVQRARLGELCFAFGSPLGEYTESVTFGIVSGLDRRSQELHEGKSIENLLQTDAEINYGNSGGPLVDLDGSVMGVNVELNPKGRAIGFAIPAETVRSIVPELLEHGSILRPRLGVSVEVIDHLADGVECERLRVSGSPDGHPLKRGDVLLSVAGKPIATRGDLFDVMRRPLAGRDTTIEIERSGTREQVAFTPET